MSCIFVFNSILFQFLKEEITHHPESNLIINSSKREQSIFAENDALRLHFDTTNHDIKYDFDKSLAETYMRLGFPVATIQKEWTAAFKEKNSFASLWNKMDNRQTKGSEEVSSRITVKTSTGINETLPNNEVIFVLHIMTKHNELTPFERKICKHFIDTHIK